MANKSTKMLKANPSMSNPDPDVTISMLASCEINQSPVASKMGRVLAPRTHAGWLWPGASQVKNR